VTGPSSSPRRYAPHDGSTIGTGPRGLARSLATWSLGLALVGSLAGCSGPLLIVRTSKPAHIYVRPSHDGEGNHLPKDAALIDLGESPAEWEVPSDLYGGAAYVKAVFDNGEREAFNVQLPKSEDDDDRETRIEHPKGLR
jgi:hypothetical protein